MQIFLKTDGNQKHADFLLGLMIILLTPES